MGTKAIWATVLLLHGCAFAQWFVDDCGNEKPIPKEWLVKYGLDASDPQIRQKDSDGDGFTNEEEWRGNTDPTQKESHPPYHTKLFLKQWIKVPFRLKLFYYDGDPKNPEKLTFQISPLDLRGPSEFLKIGDTISRTKFKIVSFDYKQVFTPNSSLPVDGSEVTVHNIETGDDVVLPLGKIVDYPTSFAAFEYYLLGDDISDGVTPFEFRVAKSREFVLKPDLVSRYKLLDVIETQAVIQAPDGSKFTVPVRPK